MGKDDLSIKIFADGADLAGIAEMAMEPWIAGFTTNPTLMRQAGVEDYRTFARDVLAMVQDRPVSFEVFADDFPTMEAQALEIASWGPNVNVKIPVTNTKGEPAAPLVERLSKRGVVCNVTAMFTLEQVRTILAALDPGTPAILSVFAGRIADSGIDPVPVMQEALEMMAKKPKAELLWASPREVLNLVQADQIGCHIITVTNGILKKLSQLGKDHDLYSLETVKMFHDDAARAGYDISVPAAPAAAIA
jgi:transaldolase